MSAENKNHALLFGAAGLLGWATLNQLLSNYPKPSTFKTVTAVLNRPVSEEDLYLPNGPDRPTLNIVSGLDLTSGTGEDLATQLKDKVEGVGNVTHCFYFVFSPVTDDHKAEVAKNCSMMQRIADALNTLSPKLESFVYPGGSRGYGIYRPGGIFKPPLTESLADTLPADYAETVSYPWFRQLLIKASTRNASGKNWNWSEICPDAVIGFTPNGSGYSLALHWAQYLSLYTFNHREQLESGKEVEVPYPGSEAGYHSYFTPVSGPILGRIAIHAALNPERCGGKVINMLDNDKPVSARDLWPGLAAWFGLRGVGPDEDANALKPGEYINRYRHLFEENDKPKGVTCGVGAGNQQLDSFGWWLTFNRQFSPERLRFLGFTEERNPLAGWLEAFKQFREAGIIF